MLGTTLHPALIGWEQNNGSHHGFMASLTKYLLWKATSLRVKWSSSSGKEHYCERQKGNSYGNLVWPMVLLFESVCINMPHFTHEINSVSMMQPHINLISNLAVCLWFPSHVKVRKLRFWVEFRGSTVLSHIVLDDPLAYFTSFKNSEPLIYYIPTAHFCAKYLLGPTLWSDLKQDKGSL